jgi:hypothetical protein
MTSRDTDPKMDEMQIELLRQAGPSRRLQLAVQLSSMVWNASRYAYDRNFPDKTEDERDRMFLTEIYGKDLAERFIAHRQKVLGPRNNKVTREH